METQRIGILYPIKAKTTFSQAVMQAITQFYNTSHTAGLEPAEIHIHPDEVNNITEIDGYRVIGDERVARGRIRVTTVPIEMADV